MGILQKRKDQGAKRKVFIVGFAPSWKEVNWEDEEAEIWTLNEFYKLPELKQMPKVRFDRWFEIHNTESPTKNNEEHKKFLKECPVPVYMQKKHDDIPNSVAYPKEKVYEFLSARGIQGVGKKYVTNSISWMLMLAIAEFFKEVHIYGVDLACKEEYLYQRPNLEYWIGVAEGLGVKVHVPNSCDLLTCSYEYGFLSDNKFRHKLIARKRELTDRQKQYEAKRLEAVKIQRECERAIDQIAGAKDDLTYTLTNLV